MFLRTILLFSLFLFLQTTVFSNGKTEPGVKPAGPAPKRIPEYPIRVCVLPFTTADIKGQERFLSGTNRPIRIPAAETLNDKDRKSMNGVMQGFVRMIDAWSNKKTADANRNVQLEEDRFDRAKMLDLYRKTVHGAARPVVLGSDYLSACLAGKSGVFAVAEPEALLSSMTSVSGQRNFPDGFMEKLSAASGVTHLIYGSVSDIRTKTTSFKGYGIETKSTVYQLDVILRMVDLKTGQTVMGGVYTGTLQEQQPIGTVDPDRFQTLMKSALEQAANEFHAKFSAEKEQQGNR